MGIGVISLVTSQKREQSGPPFAIGSADNGLSVDAVSGRIVLGNDVGDPLAPAALLSDREILTEDALFNLFAVFLNAVQTGIITRLDGQAINITGADGTSPSIQVLTGDNGFSDLRLLAGTGSTSTLTINAAGDRFTLDAAQNPGFITLSAGFPVPSPIQNFVTATRSTQIGPTLVTSNTAALQVSGNLTYRTFISGIGAGATVVDRDLDSGKLYFNSAAASLTLPNMAGANFRAGFRLMANCANVAGITVTASAGQVIRFGSLVTSSGGTISSTDVGAFISIIIINSGTWVTESFNGAWVLT
jgi:hypothetical protein